MLTKKRQQTHNSSKIIVCCLTFKRLKQATSCKTMITVIVEEYNIISQEFYDSVIDSLQLHLLKCTCDHSACLSVHAFYQRGVSTPEGTIKIWICRVKCSVCGRTHAILLSSMVPYSRVALADQVKVVLAIESGTDRNAVTIHNPSVSIHQVKLISRHYINHWKQRILSEKILLHPFVQLVGQCFALFGKQFLQISRTPNALFPAFT